MPVLIARSYVRSTISEVLLLESSSSDNGTGLTTRDLVATVLAEVAINLMHKIKLDALHLRTKTARLFLRSCSARIWLVCVASPLTGFMIITFFMLLRTSLASDSEEKVRECGTDARQREGNALTVP